MPGGAVLFDGDTRHPATAKAVGGGSLFAVAPELTALITEGRTLLVLRPLHALPGGHRWGCVSVPRRLVVWSPCSPGRGGSGWFGVRGRGVGSG